MNRGLKRGIGQDVFWPSTNTGLPPQLISSGNVNTTANVARYEPRNEGGIAWDGNFNVGNVQGLATGVLNVGGAICAESAFLGLCFIATQVSGAGRFDARGTGNGSTVGNYVAMSNGETIAGVNFGGSRTATQLADVAVYEAVATENWNSGAAGTKVQWWTTPNGTASRTICSTFNQDGSAALAQSALTNTASRVDLTLGAAQTFSTTVGMQHAVISYTATDTWTIAPLGFGTTFAGIAMSPTIINASTLNAAASGANLITAGPTFTVDTATGTDLATNNMVVAGGGYTRANSGTFTSGTHIGFASTPVVNATGSTMTSIKNFRSIATITAGTVTTLTHIGLEDGTPVGSGGTVGTQIGVDIPSFVKGGTNIGIRCVPQVQFGTAAACTIDSSGNLTTTGTLSAGVSTLATSALTNTASRTDVTLGAAQTFSTTSSMTHTIMSYTSTDTWTVAPLGFGTTWQGIIFTPTIKNASGSNVSPGSLTGMSMSPTVTVDTQTAIALGTSTMIGTGGTYNVASSGTFTSGTHIGVASGCTTNGTGCTMSSVTLFRALCTVTLGTVTAAVGYSSIAPAVAGTLTTYTGMLFADATGAGTVTNQYAIDIPAMLKGGTTNVGLRCTPAIVLPPTTCTVTSNAGTVPVTCSNAKLTNSSAATITVTMAVTNAQDGQITDVRIYDATAASVAITWVNTEDGKTAAPTTTIGASTTARPTHARFMYNSAASKWTCIGL